MKEYIAYKGRAFQIEWYYSEKGKSQALDYYKGLNPTDRRKVLKLFRLMGEMGQLHNKTMFRSEGQKIYAFKPQPHRFLCFFFEGQKIIVTNGFMKKQQKLPKSEKERAVRLMEDYNYRIQKDSYYDQE